MIMVLKPNTAKNEIKILSDRIREKGLKPVEFEGVERTVIHVHGNVKEENAENLGSAKCVEKVVRILKPFKLASREHHSDTTIKR